MASLTELSSKSDVNELWPLYKAEHSKQYGEAEDKERFEIFKNNLKHIIDHNEKFATGEVTYTMGLNQFADMRAEERFHGGAFKK